MGSYRLPDEPRPGAWAHLVVPPHWPLFAVMFAGPWLAWPWFVVNAWALGSPTKVKETALAVGGFVGNAVLIVVLLVLHAALGLSDGAIPYLIIVLMLWKLAITYALAEMQGQGFALYTWFGGPQRSGMMVVVVGFVVRPMLAARLGSLLSVVLL